MGLFDGAKSAITGNRAYRAHVDGNKLSSEGKPREAGEKYRAALKLYEEAASGAKLPVNYDLAYAMLLMREGELEKARQRMLELSKDKTLSKDNWFQLRIQYALYQWKVGEIDKAMETMGRAAAYKMNGNVYSTMGMFWVDKAKETGEFEEALKYNMEALDYDDEDGATLDNLGQLYEAMAEAEADQAKASEYMDKALDFYKKAHAAKPRQITTLYYLARMLHRRGEDDKARKVLSIRDTLYYSAMCPVTRDMIEALAREIG